MIWQHSIKNSVWLNGIGLHSGEPVTLSMHPAPPDTGVVFRRVDLHPVVLLPAYVSGVGDLLFNTSLKNGQVQVATVEHVLSALSALAIDNVYIDLDVPETPAMDGSALAFVQLVESAGIVEQEKPKLFIAIKQPILVKEGDKYASLSPSVDFSVSVTIDFNHPAILKTSQIFCTPITAEIYKNQICYARTFGFLSDYDYLKQRNLAKGASLENTIVLSDTDILNKEGLQDPAEFIKHKILDTIGDLALLKHPIIGAFEAYKPGHALNHKLCQAVLTNTNAWTLVTKAA